MTTIDSAIINSSWGSTRIWQQQHSNGRLSKQSKAKQKTELTSETFGIVRLPVPGRGAHLLDAVLRLPAQSLLGETGIGVHRRHVARATAHHLEGNFDAGCLLKSGDYLEWEKLKTYFKI